MEQDFFLNVCHLQLHRRSRALHRLAMLIRAQGSAAGAATAGAGLGAGAGAGSSAPGAGAAAGVAATPVVLLRCIQDVVVPLLAAILVESGSGGG